MLLNYDWLVPLRQTLAVLLLKVKQKTVCHSCSYNSLIHLTEVKPEGTLQHLFTYCDHIGRSDLQRCRLYISACHRSQPFGDGLCGH